MMQTGGLALLFAWLLFATLLAVLGFFVLRTPADPMGEAQRRPDEWMDSTDARDR